MIGQFDLDPNRVLDIMLEFFEKQAWNLNFIDALRDLNYKKDMSRRSSASDSATTALGYDDVEENSSGK